MVYSAISDSVGTVSQFTRRQKVIVSHSGALTAYQKMLTIPYQPQMQAAYGDIRFTTIAGVYIPYWLESKTDSSTANIWIKADLLDGDTSIWMYSGNDGLSSGSDITTTMIFGDDFTGDLSKWTVQSGTWSTENGTLKRDASSAWTYLRSNTQAPSIDYITEYKYKRTMNTVYTLAITNANNPMAYNASLIIDDAGSTGIRLHQNWGGAITSMITYARTDGTYYIHSVYSVDGANFLRLFRDNRTVLGTTNTVVNSGGADYFGYTYAVTQAYDDWIIVRKYTATEPTYSIGTPQHQRKVPQFM